MTKEFITKTEIKTRRKWTESLITKYLPDPDLIKNNPMFRGASEMKLYKVSRIDEIEKCELFLIDFQKTSLRRKKSKKMVNTKTDNLLNKISNISISVKEYNRQELVKMVIDSYNQRNNHKEPISQRETDQTTMERLMVNYIRHELTSYDDILMELYSKTGKEQAYKLLNERIYKSIGEVYPYLIEECALQIITKFN
jgi:hypothetical protein